jgi:hypothetical protein
MFGFRERGLIEGLLDLDCFASVDELVHIRRHRASPQLTWLDRCPLDVGIVANDTGCAIVIRTRGTRVLTTAMVLEVRDTVVVYPEPPAVP